MTRIHASVALALLASLGAGSAAAQPDPYRFTVLSELSTPFGPFERIEPLALNNRGEVAGTACGEVAPGQSGCAAFRARRGQLEDLDPEGSYNSRALALNKRGVVLGELTRDGEKVYFKTARSGRVRFLEGGLPRRSSGRLFGSFARAFNDRGVVVAGVLTDDGEVPYVYRDSVGSWQPLTAGEPELEGELRFEGINDRGDAVLVTVTEDFRSAAYLYRRDRSIEVIRPLGEGILILDGPTRSGAVSGRIVGVDLLDTAVYFNRAGGFREIHPEGFRQSYALQTLADGTALVGAWNGALEAPVVFYFTYHPEEGLRELWTEDDLAELRRRAGCKKPNRNDFFPPRLNRDREAILTLICSGGSGVLHHARDTGFTLLEELMEAEGLGDVSGFGRDINDRGQLLYDAFIDDSIRAVVMTPVERR